jgi:hypothetical protein
MASPRHPGGDPSDLYERIKELEPNADRHIANQHVVSKVVLKGFAAMGQKRQGWQLTPFNLRLGHEQRSRGLSGCGKIPNFLHVRIGVRAGLERCRGLSRQCNLSDAGTRRLGGSPAIGVVSVVVSFGGVRLSPAEGGRRRAGSGPRLADGTGQTVSDLESV